MGLPIEIYKNIGLDLIKSNVFWDQSINTSSVIYNTVTEKQNKIYNFMIN